MVRPSARLFFALWPHAQLQARMARCAAQLHALAGGRMMPAASLHMTLVFLGEVALEDIARVQAAAGSVHAEAFSLRLDRLGAWRGNGIGWLAPSAPAPAASALSATLRSALRKQAIAFDGKTFKPHVTLVRKLIDTRGNVLDLAPVEPINWEVSEFVLLRSERSVAGARYEPLGRWPLATR